ncbi:MAG: carboxypeptidase regulatory-like domain-containing protein [Coriobacteriia bacterium]|nr:carboxypeptidase regulatory-like domain-containing protein [Coriobacteriia bacterium]
MTIEHEKPESTSSGQGCTACHPTPAAAAKPWNGSCATADCHTATSGAPMHLEMAVAHAVSESNGVCLGCHAGSELGLIHTGAENPDTGDASCLVCHTGETGEPATNDCTVCHFTFDEHYDEVAHQSDTLIGCSGTGCHETPDLFAVHTQRNAEFGCVGCHDSTRVAVQDAIAEGDTSCFDCHADVSPTSPHYSVHWAQPPLFTVDPVTNVHTNYYSYYDGTSGSAPTGDCAMCHTSNLVEEHNGRWDATIGFWSRRPRYDSEGNALTCNTCHGSSDSTVTGSIADGATACDSCHAIHGPVFSGAHASTFVDSPEVECADCHEDDLVSEHDGTYPVQTADGLKNVTGCAVCHSYTYGERGDVVQAAISETNDTRCSACHAAYHTDSTAHDASSAASLECGVCHAEGQTTIDVTSVHSTCATCHQAERLGAISDHTAECSSCHATAGTDYHAEMDGLHTFTAMGESCKSCHDQTLPEAHADYLDRYPAYSSTCALCHKNADPDSINWDTASADCSTCHEIHGDVEVLHTSTASQGCVRCHDSADVRLVHAATAGDPDTSCDVCHNATFELSADMTAECETCHNAGGVPFHTSMNVLHIGLGTSGTCEGSACHVRDVATLHEEFIGPGTQYPQYQDTCSLCHLNDDPDRIDWDVATNGTCWNCHGAPHDRMSHVASSVQSLDCAGCHDDWVVETHNAYEPTGGSLDNCNTCHRNPLAGNMTWDKSTSDCEGCHDKYPAATNHYPADKHLAVHADVCVDCHYMDLKSEHVKVDVACIECHTDPSDSAIIAAGWNMNCDQCHMDNHDDEATRHASTRADCSTSGCHESDVSAIHSGLPWMGCKSCHTGPAQLASDLTKNCTDSGCHDDGYHTTLPGLHTATASAACTRCHTERLADGSQLEPIHDAACATCHNSTIDASTKTAECTTCHNTTVAPYHAAMDSTHDFTTMSSGCQQSGCHLKTLPEEHARYLSRYPSYADTCALCHLNANAGRIDWATASADCSTCHEIHGDIAVVHTATASQSCRACHETQNALDIHVKKDGSGDTNCALCHNAAAGRINWDPATVSMECTYCHGTYAQIDPAHYPVAAHDASAQTGCNQCHYKDMKAEHFLATVSPAVTCVSCHELKVDAFAAPWDKTCGSCHPTNHRDKNTKHLSTSASCGGTGCHDIANVDAIHSATSSGCKACHVSPSVRATTTTCTAAGCHASIGTNHHEAHNAASVNPSGCKGCHSMYLDDEHSALGYACAACHDSTNSAVVAAIAAGDLRCKTCHPGLHGKQNYEFNPSMSSVHRVSVELPGMRSSFVVGGRSYTWSLPSTTSFLKSGWTASSMMSCDSCHAYTGAAGPHGATMQVKMDPGYPADWQTKRLAGSSSFSDYNSSPVAPAYTGGYVGTSTGAVICDKCHNTNYSNMNEVHGKGAHEGAYCTDCHTQMPHGWRLPRLLAYTSDPSPYAARRLAGISLTSHSATSGWDDSDCYAGCHSHENTVSPAWPTADIVVTTGAISGTVKNSSGAAISGATVSIAGKTATTSSTGVYTVSDVTAGTYTMTVSAAGYTSWSGSVTITVGGTLAQNVTLSAVPVTTGAIGGTVKNPAGAAISGATVSVAGKTATTSSTGVYSVTGITAGTYTMTVSATGYTSWTGQVSITAGGTATKNVTLAAVPTATNLARTGTASASSQASGSYSAAKAIDGSTSTYWRSSSGGTQWLRVDLGSAKTISSVVVNWTSYYAKSYRIETSNDGSNWTQQFTTTSGNGGIDTIAIPSVSARYVRVYCTSANSTNYRVNEFEVWGN